eukprot:5853918-Pleurochrysis_carterae.AAC.1
MENAPFRGHKVAPPFCARFEEWGRGGRKRRGRRDGAVCAVASLVAWAKSRDHTAVLASPCITLLKSLASSFIVLAVPANALHSSSRCSAERMVIQLPSRIRFLQPFRAHRPRACFETSALCACSRAPTSLVCATAFASGGRADPRPRRRAGL